MKNNNSKNENMKIKRKLAEVSGIPSEVVLGVPIVTITGCHELLIMNYRGILEYTDFLVRVQSKTGQIKIVGKKLSIDYYSADEMKISGKITFIEYD